MISSTPHTHRCDRTTRQAAGWSLIELLVVVGIIAILLAILINTAAESRGPVEQTKVTLKALMGIYDEYEASMSSTSALSTKGMTGGGIQNFCTIANQLERTRKLLFTLGKDVAIDTNADGRVDTIKDGWGGDLEFLDGVNAGAAIHRPYKGAYFASMGPDGKWGDYREQVKKETAQSFNATAVLEYSDNVYSFNLGD